MLFDETVSSLQPEMIIAFKRSLELGKWPDGRCMSQEQKALCLEVILIYEKSHDVPKEARLGYVDRSSLMVRGSKAQSSNIIQLLKGE